MTPELAIILLLIAAIALTPTGMIVTNILATFILFFVCLIFICIGALVLTLVHGVRGFIRWASE